MCRNINRFLPDTAEVSNLISFPLDRSALERLRRIKSKMGTEMAVAAIMPLVESLLLEIDRMEALAAELSPPSEDLQRALAELRGAVERLSKAFDLNITWI